MGPLDGVRVVELAHIMAGPVCGLMLADLGAEVIKVEKIPGGDDTRRFIPPAIDGVSAAFLVVNRNKRDRAQPENGRRPRGAVPLDRRCRRRHREFPARHHGAPWVRL